MLQELAGAVRKGEVSPRELVEESLRRIEKGNADLNAVVARCDETALAEADRLSDERRRGPLAGVPLLVKDLSHVAGMETSFGSTLYAGSPAAAIDSTVVARLRAAGAIVVGKTNTPAFGWTAYTENLVYGATRNPWNTERSPGGSSGGSAAALAAGFAPIATTTDGGGSVRIPASLCGLVGYKPTLGLIGRDGAPNWMTFSTAGATGHTVADVVLEASVVAGPTGADINALAPGSVPIDAASPGRVVACRTLRADVDPHVDAAFRQTLDVIDTELGLPIVTVDDPFGEAEIPLNWFVISAAELAQALGEHEERWDTVESGLADILRFGRQVSTADYVAAQRRRYAAADRLEQLLGGDGVLVTPTLNVTSWAPGGPLPDAAGAVTGDPSIAVNTLELNFTGQPGVSVPIGVGPEGVPIGMQIAAPRFGDRYALGLAAALEQVRPWPATAAGYEPFVS
jgi:Asp-tRNA(Asn)/Glu-tRNA(Gln) amidotransferase A subunit family amidase